MELDAERLGEACNEFGVGARLRPQGVVEVCGVQRQSPGRRKLRQRVEEADAVGAAADADDHMGDGGTCLREEAVTRLREVYGFDDRQGEAGTIFYQTGMAVHRRDYTIPNNTNAFFGPLFLMV